MEVKVKKAGTWAITPAGPIEDIVVGQVIGDSYTPQFRQDLVDTGYAEVVVGESDAPDVDLGFDVDACEDKDLLLDHAASEFGLKINKNKSLDNIKAEIHEAQEDQKSQGE